MAKKTLPTQTTHLQPLGPRVLVRRDNTETISKGGLILPGVAQEKPLRGTVERLGLGARNKDGTPYTWLVKPGDRVMFTNWAGNSQTKSISDDFIIINESDLLALIVN